MFPLLWIVLVVAAAALAQTPTPPSSSALERPVVVNVDHRGLPLQPSFDVSSAGTLRFVWNTYRNHNERMFTASFDRGRRSRTQELAAGAGVYWSPLFLADGSAEATEESGWALWQRRLDGEWRIVSRRLERGFWKPIESLSAAGRNGVTPTGVVHHGALWSAWEDHGGAANGGPQRIVLRRPHGDSVAISQSGKPCYRPALASKNDELWALWDCYEGLDYAVYSRRVAPRMGATQKLSGAMHAMDATAVYGSRAGLVAVWVAEQDVLGKGAIDQRHEVHAAVLGPDGWGKPETIADLSHSLLSRIEPEVGAIWGYAGRRLEPLVIEDEGAVWMLWERKIEHDGRSTLPGELNGRRFDGSRWLAPVRLHQNLVQYGVPSGARARQGRLTAAGFDPQHNLYAFDIDLRGGLGEFEPTDITGWRPIELPLAGWKPEERPSIDIDGRPHQLYWGDLHVHTSLTADAEGEVDELMHYARDKARLDVVVMQENDAASWLNANAQGAYRGQVLTDSEYALSVYFSRRYTEPGRFVALPGWEWSDRTDDGKANHRTVIFAGEDAPLLRHSEEDDFDALCDMVEAAGGVMNSQHPTFRLVDRPCDGNIEVAAGWGVYINQPDKIHADLTAGFRVGFVATSDGHRRNPGVGGGLTGFWAPELTSEAMLDALKQRRVFATNGSRIVLDSRANGRFMGEDVSSSGEVELSLRARSPRPIVRTVLVRDGDEIHHVEGSGNSLDHRFEDRPGAGFHWYYWRVEIEGASPNYPGNIKVAEGHLGWTTPHRVTVR